MTDSRSNSGLPPKADGCPFCGEPESPYPVNGHDDRYKCGTTTDKAAHGEPERYRTHSCYMNQIRQLQTGDTDYGQGWRDGIEAAFGAMQTARHEWRTKNPPLRRPEARTNGH